MNFGILLELWMNVQKTKIGNFRKLLIWFTLKDQGFTNVHLQDQWNDF